MINGTRLWNHLMELGEIGKSEGGGLTRLAYTEQEKQAKQIVKKYMEEAGLTVRTDSVGNLIGRKDGLNPAGSLVLTGSHIDTVQNGGKFDGALGVIGAIEALQTMREQGLASQDSIEVIAFSDEEGARFGFGMLGSRARAGSLDEKDLQHVDDQGITIYDAMQQAGLHPETFRDSQCKESLKAYVELHIEQGKVLELEGISVGVVTGIAAPLWMKFTLEGEADHAGATPMEIRHDALAAAASIISMVEATARKHGRAVATVGQMHVEPGGINIVPGRVTFSVDVRDISADSRDEAEQAIRINSQRICRDRMVSLTVKELQRINPVACASSIQNEIRQACADADIASVPIVSGAAHDAIQLADKCPVGMIFVRSKDGVSHRPEEWSQRADCENGTEVLLRTLMKLSGSANV